MGTVELSPGDAGSRKVHTVAAATFAPPTVFAADRHLL